MLERYLEVGFNYRMTDIQAAVGLVQLGKLDAMVARRRELAARYNASAQRRAGAGAGARPGVRDGQLPVVLGAARPGLPGRAGTACWPHSPAEGVSARRGIMAAHLEPAYAGHPHGPLPVTERLTRDSLILPLFHTMTHDQQDRVVEVLRAEALR